jgi:carboxyl-terminal processing protease
MLKFISTALRTLCVAAPLFSANRILAFVLCCGFGAQIFAAAPTDARAGIDHREATVLVRLLEEVSFRKLEPNQTNCGRAVENFIEALDPDRSYFTQPEIETLKSTCSAALMKMLELEGNIESARTIYSQYSDRVSARAEWISREIAREDASNLTEMITPPPTSPDWAASADALDRRWKQRLHFEQAKLALNQDDPQARLARLKHHYDAFAAHATSRSPEEIDELFLNALVQVCDHRNRYYRPSIYNRSELAGSANSVGIGATVSYQGTSCVFESLIPGGPAAMSGKIEVGDRLIEIESEPGADADIAGLDLSGIVDRLRGRENTEVTIEIEHPRSLTRERISLKRSRVFVAQRAETSLYEIKLAQGGKRAIGVIKVPALYGAISEANSLSAAEDVRASLKDLTKDGAQGIVLDIRRNGGGLLDQAIQLTGLFVGDGPVVQTKAYTQEVRVHNAENQDSPYDKPVLVLVDKGTASGAVVVASALQAYRRALVAGEKPDASDPSVQTIIDLKNLLPGAPKKTGAVKLTVHHFYRLDGSAMAPDSLTPDITLPGAPFAAFPVDLRPSAGLFSDKVPSALFRKPANPLPVAPLRASSERRQNELPELKLITAWREREQASANFQGGSLEEFKRWSQARVEAEPAYAQEARRSISTPPESEAVTRIRTYPENHDETIAQAAETEPDLALREALRILSDLIDLQAPTSDKIPH